MNRLVLSYSWTLQMHNPHTATRGTPSCKLSLIYLGKYLNDLFSFGAICVFTETLVWLKLKCGILPKLGCNDREAVVDHLKKKNHH